MNSVNMKVNMNLDNSIFKSELCSVQGMCCGAWELSSLKSEGGMTEHRVCCALGDLMSFLPVPQEPTSVVL